MLQKLKKITIYSCLVLLLFNFQPPVGYAETTDEEVNDTENGEEVSTSEEISDVATSAPSNIEVTDISEMELVAETEHLELYLSASNAEFAVKEKGNGYIWYSNPAERANDPIANAENKSLMSAQIALTFINDKGQSAQYDTYKDSVSEDQFTIEKTESGFKVVYEIGKESQSLDQVPQRISSERFHSLILDKLSEDDRRDIEKRFKYIEEEDVYERRDNTFSKLTLERTLRYFEEVGYTEEDVAFDNEEHGALLEEEASDPSFTIPLLVEIEEDQLVVTIDGEEIEFLDAFPINELRVLPFFGAANTEQSGYIFVPDGSGALIELNNGKGAYESFAQRIYGFDEVEPMTHLRRRTVSESIRMPVFGMKQDDHAFLAIVEEGDAIGIINADVSDDINSYNSVYSSFIIKQSEPITLQGGDQSNTAYAIQKGEFTDTIKIRYSFMDNEEANYVGMAKRYQQYLVEKYNWEPLNDDSVSFYLELTGSILKRKSFLGIPYRSLHPLTTFEQGEEIVKELLDADIDNIKVRYSGWFNRGVNHKIPTKVNVDRVLGGEKGLKEFNEFLTKHNVELYPDVAFSIVYKNSFGFSPTKHASRFISREVAERYPINPATYRRSQDRSSYYLLSPDHLGRSVDGFLEDYEKLNINNVSLRDLGEKINADFREKKVISREQSKIIADEQLRNIHDHIPNVMSSGGNALVLPYTKEIVNAPTNSSHFNITDKAIPFYQLVLHGYINYAGEPINLSVDQDIKYHLLKSLETGSNIYFSWFYEDGSEIKDTEFNHLFSSNYKLWIDDAKQMYQEVNNVLKDVQGENITAHHELARGVYETTYGDKLTIIVNYNDTPVTVDGITIEAEDYIIR